MAILRRDAAKYDKEDVEPTLEEAARIAAYLRMRTTEQPEYYVCMRLRRVVKLLWVIGSAFAAVSTLIVHRPFWLPVLPERFAGAPPTDVWMSRQILLLQRPAR